MVTTNELADYLVAKANAPRVKKSARSKTYADLSRELIHDILTTFPEMLNDSSEEIRDQILDACGIANRAIRGRRQ